MTAARVEPSKGKLVGAVTQSFAVLRVLSVSAEPLGVSAIAREAGVNPSTTFNILRTLVLEGAVVIEEKTKSYSLGEGLLALCAPLLERSFVQDIGIELARLSAEFSCLAGLWQVVGDRVVLVERAVSDRPVRLDMAIKQRMPLFLGALGRAHAAALRLSDADLSARFGQLRWEGAIDVDGYIGEVRAAEELGYAVDRQALYPGVVSVAAILTNRDGVPVYGLTASDIANNLDDARIAALGARMAALKKAFSLL